MRLRSCPIFLILIAVGTLGCNRRSDGPTSGLTSQSAIPTPRFIVPAFAPIDEAPTLTEESLQAVEQKYACRLPDDYRQFLLENNGGFPSPDCVVFTESGHETASDVFCFLAVGDERAWASMEWHSETYADRLPKSTLPIARDSCGNLWLLSVGGENAGSVFFWDHGSYDTFDHTDSANWPRVAASFQKFRNKLDMFYGDPEDRLVPSRYALVKQAADVNSEKFSDFSTRANPEYVWHCTYNDRGSVTMEFVQYDVHASVPHTDGYSRLRASKGLIKESETGSPE